MIHIGHQLITVTTGKPVTASQGKESGQLAHKANPDPSNNKYDKDQNDDNIKRSNICKGNHIFSWYSNVGSYPTNLQKIFHKSDYTASRGYDKNLSLLKSNCSGAPHLCPFLRYTAGLLE